MSGKGDGGGGRLLVWNGIVVRIPPLVVRPDSAGDLAAALEFARDHGLRVRLGRPERDDTGALAERAVTLDLTGLREAEQGREPVPEEAEEGS